MLDVFKHFHLESAEVTQLRHEEDNEPYQVWKLKTEEKTYILKEAKEYESEVYRTFLKDAAGSVPHIYKMEAIDGKTYLLMEFVEGNDLRKCTRQGLTMALDALIKMQKAAWEDSVNADVGFTFEESLNGRKRRGAYLNDPELETAYGKFLSLYEQVPRTLCHDDFLPFNVIVSQGRAVLIDWEFAGILPYPVSFARLIAHGEEEEEAFFYMTQADREFAIRYYYENLLKDKGITWDSWLETLDYFLLHEYCEWVMIGYKYGDTELELFKKYLPIAKRHAQKLLASERK